MKGIRLVAALAFALLALGSGIAFAEQGSGSEPPADPVREVVADRTATSQTFELPDGAKETRIFESPINYRDQKGDWRPIGEELEEAFGSAITNGQNSFDLSLPEELGRGAVRIATKDGWVSSELLGAGTEAAEVEGNVASYEADQGGVDFELASLATGLKEDIVLKDISAPRKYSYLLKASGGLSLERAEDGSIAFLDSEGEPVLVLPAPVMLDSKPGTPALSDAINYELASRGEGEWLLSLEPDFEWLSSPERVWPVRLDPSVTVPNPSLDCNYLLYNITTSKTVGCGSTGLQRLRAQYKPAYNGAVQERERSALEFSTSSVPSTAYVAEATVDLYAPWEGENAKGAELRRATKTWTKSVAWTKYDGFHNWTTAGGDFTTEGAELSGHKEGWWKFSNESLAALVEGWASGKIANQGLLLKLTEEESCQPPSCTNSWATFNSSAATESGTHPYLAVTYFPKAPSSSKVVSPIEGTVSANRLKLKAKWSEPGVTGIRSFEYKTPGKRYQTIPASLIRNTKGEEVSWPLTVSGFESEPLYFEAGHANAELTEKGGEIEIRANFIGPIGIEGYSEAAKAKINPDKGGTQDASAPVGPGSVDLLTGSFTVSNTDVSIPGITAGLEFSRSHSSRSPGTSTDTSPLGRGWMASTPVEAAGGFEWHAVQEVVVTAEDREEGLEDYALLIDNEGYEYAFEKSGSSYVTPPELTGYVLAHPAGATFTLSDPAGNVTTFESTSGGAEYWPRSISMPGSANTATMVYESYVPKYGAPAKLRLTQMIAPSPGLTCTAENATTTPGCRSLVFNYKRRPNGEPPKLTANVSRRSPITDPPARKRCRVGKWPNTPTTPPGG